MTTADTPHKKLRVGIFFGGKSAEHEISIQSAKNVLEALDPERFSPILIGIDKTGSWHVQQSIPRLEGGTVGKLSVADDTSSLTLLPGKKGELVDARSKQQTAGIDVAFPILHGPLGEDGTIQGFLELANIPYVGSDVLGSAVGMDKDVMKRLLRDAGIPIAPFQAFTFANRQAIRASTIFEQLSKPVFVKPANMGSSVGVSKAETPEELDKAIEVAFSYDTKIVVESFVEGEEIECAVLGNEAPQASIIGRIIPRKGDFYSYEAKYLDEHGAVLEIPAQIPEATGEKARQLAIKTFRVLNCEGMGRIDMFATKDGEVLVNEINTIPGFTKVSMYPKLWEASGLPYSELITKLITLAIERHERRNGLKTTYEKSLHDYSVAEQ